jgi:D-alanine-D-alanine ligase-like ATP-grasp enzyme
MARHVIFVAPFFMDATLRFLRGTVRLEDVHVSLISQDPLEALPPELRDRLAGHWRVDDVLNPARLVEAARELAGRLGKPHAMLGPLEQLQVPLALARETLGIAGLGSEAARNFRDKSRMKHVLRDAGVPCARHALAGDAATARAFAAEVGFPLVAKPPAGAGAKGTFRIDDAGQLDEWLARVAPAEAHPTLLEEFVQGAEHTFDSVMIDGQLVWHSISQYLPSPLIVLDNPWIQWCVYLPKSIDGPEYDAIREAADRGLHALGMDTGLSHMEWFRLADGRIALSEVGARPPGAQITTLLSCAHDIDFYHAWPRLLVDHVFDPPPRRFAAGAAYFRGQGRGTVRHIHGLDEAQRRYGSLVMEVKLPRQGQPPSDSYEGDGYVIVRHEDSDVVRRALSDIVSLVRVELA